MNVSNHSSTASQNESPTKLSSCDDQRVSDKQIACILELITSDLLEKDNSNSAASRTSSPLPSLDQVDLSAKSTFTLRPRSPVVSREQEDDPVEEDDVLLLARGLHAMVFEASQEHEQQQPLPPQKERLPRPDLRTDVSRGHRETVCQLLLPDGMKELEELLNDATRVAEWDGEDDDMISTGTLDSLDVYRARRQRRAANE